MNTDHAGTAATRRASVFDEWITLQLRREYSFTLAEPLPDDMLRLLDTAVPA